MELLQSYKMPKIGDKAPDFAAITTTGKLQFSEYNKDHWVILFSHPADFTPVCTTELSAFAEDHDFFRKHQTKLLGLSIDSIHSHLAWVNSVHEKTGILFDFPIIADLDMHIAQLYGMIHPGVNNTSTVRAVFFIDPEGIVRLIMYYPMNVGRNLEEIKRAL
jgi:peroxiredoxin (alkyl hydroperoxide reductase subunit C)